MTQLVAGNVAVVTGAARGIGLGLARAFAARGLRLAIADIDADALENARAELTAAGAQVLAHQTDVSSEAAVFSLAGATRERYGTFDVVCNNAGVGNEYSACWEKNRDEWELMIAVNLWGVIHGIRAFVPHLVEKNSGHVLNTSSMSGLKSGSADMSDYAMAKSGVIAVTESLSEDLKLAAPGVGATVLCPGYIRTPLSSVQAEKQQIKRRRDGAPEVRWGEPLEPSDAALIALRAIESDHLYAVPAPSAWTTIQARFDRLRSEISQQAVELSN